MTEPDEVDLDDAAIRLAMRLEQDIIGHDGTAVLGACCWLIAGLIRQAAHERGLSLTESIASVIQQVWRCAAFLEWRETRKWDDDGPRH
jgi:hypothetical protein